MAKIFYGIVNNIDNQTTYNITIFTEEGEDIRLIPKFNFLEPLEKDNIVKITTWRRKNVVTFKYEKATDEEVFQLYQNTVDDLVPDGDLLPNFEMYKDLLIVKPKDNGENQS